MYEKEYLLQRGLSWQSGYLALARMVQKMLLLHFGRNHRSEKNTYAPGQHVAVAGSREKLFYFQEKPASSLHCKKWGWLLLIEGRNETTDEMASRYFSEAWPAGK